MHPMTQRLRGMFGICLTPFRRDGQVDIDRFERHIDAVCESCVDGFIVCGSTSEFVYLGYEENCRLMEIASRINAGRKMLICGAAGADVRTAQHYLAHMDALGAAYALVPPPYYFAYTQDEVFAFFQRLAEVGASARIIAYQIPAFTNDIGLPAYERLLELPHIAGVKNSSANIKQIMHQIQMRDHARPDFAVLTGTDDALLPCLLGGCDGSCTALAAIMPRAIRAIYDRVASNDLPGARRLQNGLQPLLRLADSLTFPIGYKALGEACGFPMGSLRQPLGAGYDAATEALVHRFRDMISDLYREEGLV